MPLVKADKPVEFLPVTAVSFSCLFVSPGCCLYSYLADMIPLGQVCSEVYVARYIYSCCITNSTQKPKLEQAVKVYGSETRGR